MDSVQVCCFYNIWIQIIPELGSPLIFDLWLCAFGIGSVLPCEFYDAFMYDACIDDACIDYTYLENCSIFVKDGVETRPFWEVDFRMRIVQTLGRKFEICKWFSLLAGLSLPMWTWAGVWIAGQKRPFATSWICLSRQEGVQTKAWPDKKADLQRCLDKTPWNCAHLPNWFAPFVFL